MASTGASAARARSRAPTAWGGAGGGHLKFLLLGDLGPEKLVIEDLEFQFHGVSAGLWASHRYAARVSTATAEATDTASQRPGRDPSTQHCEARGQRARDHRNAPLEGGGNMARGGKGHPLVGRHDGLEAREGRRLAILAHRGLLSGGRTRLLLVFELILQADEFLREMPNADLVRGTHALGNCHRAAHCGSNVKNNVPALTPPPTGRQRPLKRS